MFWSTSRMPHPHLSSPAPSFLSSPAPPRLSSPAPPPSFRLSACICCTSYHVGISFLHQMMLCELVLENIIYCIGYKIIMLGYHVEKIPSDNTGSPLGLHWDLLPLFIKTIPSLMQDQGMYGVEQFHPASDMKMTFDPDEVVDHISISVCLGYYYW